MTYYLPEPGTPLTERHVEVLRLAADGLTNAEIGRRLFLTPDTVKVHMRRIAVKMRARNRAHVIHLAWQMDYLTLEYGPNSNPRVTVNDTLR